MMTLDGQIKIHHSDETFIFLDLNKFMNRLIVRPQYQTFPDSHSHSQEHFSGKPMVKAYSKTIIIWPY